MKRGDVVTVAMSGDYGKPRPAIIIQSDHIDKSESVLLVLVTSHERDAPHYRMLVEPTLHNGLKLRSYVMVDKIVAAPRSKCGKVIGSLEPEVLDALSEWLIVMIGLAD